MEVRFGEGRLREKIRDLAEKWVDGERKRQSLIEAAPRIEGWITSAVQRAAIETLDPIPVYRVKDDLKGMVVRASLSSVRIEKREVVAVMSVMQLTLTSIGIIAAALLIAGLLYVVLVRGARDISSST